MHTSSSPMHDAQNLGMELDQLVAALRRAGWSYDKAVSELERWWLLQELDAADGHRTAAAEKMGIHRNTLAKRMQKLDIKWHGYPRRRSNKLLAQPGESATVLVANSVTKGGRGESPEQPPAFRSSSTNRLNAGGLKLTAILALFAVLGALPARAQNQDRPWLTTKTKVELSAVATAIAADCYSTAARIGPGVAESDPITRPFVHNNLALSGACGAGFSGVVIGNRLLSHHTRLRSTLNWSIAAIEFGVAAHNFSLHRTGLKGSK